MSKQPKSVTVNVVDARQPIPFFSFNAAYTVAPDATNSSLLDDAQCWIDAARAIVQDVAMELDGEHRNTSLRLFGAYHLLDMVDGAVGAVCTSEGRKA